MMVEGDGLDPEQTPPASTRWEQAAPDEDDDALVPPYAPSRGASGGEAESAAVAPGEADTVEPEPPTVEEDAFPFEAVTAPDEQAFPFETSPEAAGAGRAPAAQAGDEADQTDDFPVGAFDIEGAGAGMGAEREPAEAPDREHRAEQGGGLVVELAERLEGLAARLRSDGPDAVDAEIESHDAFSRLMGAMLAGYLAGRQE